MSLEDIKLEYIKWVDSRSSDDWTEVDRIEPTCIVCETVGWVVKENSDVLVVSGTRCLEIQQVCLLMYIPRIAVTQRSRPVPSRFLGAE